MRRSHLALVLILVTGLVTLLWYTVDPNLHNSPLYFDERPFNKGGDNVDPDLYTIPPSLDQLSDSQVLQVYHRLTNSFSILCRNHMRLGPLGASGKEICADRMVKPKQPCLVYSFGSNNDFDFEAMVVNDLQCEVHTFDHTMGRFKKTLEPKGVSLHLKGLDGKTDRTQNLWTLDDLIEELGHKGKVIDILKLDVEEYEWPALDQMMTSGTLNFVRQLLVEFHMKVRKPISKAEKAKRVTVLSRLYTCGFRTFSREKTTWLSEYVADLHHPVSNLVEMSFINLRYLSRR